MLGRIAGHIFDDSNNNGRWDGGEAAIPNVAVSLRGRSEQRSDRQGNYRFDDAAPLKTKVALVNKTLPIEFAVLSATEVPVTPSASQTVTVDFPRFAPEGFRASSSKT
ncbi:MAG: hypothetical protein KY445_02265 [Armatimonadetes bacterium]|nr:hypothetical protein [Armatimonadota bacterium]